MSIIQINSKVIESTLAFLKQVGHVECVVLWLAKKQGSFLNVQTVYLPQQVADYDYFHIPQESMAKLFAYLRQTRFVVAAQVHTHPGHAYHSSADDKWAIIRHVGGLSLVIPKFAATTFPENFVENAAVFSLTEGNQWDKIPQNMIAQHYMVTL